MYIVRNFYKYVLILPAFLVPVWADAATLSAVPASAQISVGSTIVVSVQVDSEGTPINSAEGILTFPSDIFEAVSVNQSPSIFTLWIQSPANTGGSIAFNGGLPAPGYSGSGGRLFTVVLRAKTPGTGVLSVGSAAVRANDGLGTDVLRTVYSATIVVEQPAAAPAPTESVPAAEAPKAASSGAVVISSATHPSQDSWYKASVATLTWKVPAGADAVQTIVSEEKGATPSVIYRPAISQKTTPELEDGVWYFNLRPHTQAGWGPISSYRIQVDTTAPELTSADIAYKSDSGVLVLRGVSASDALSGLQKFEILVDNAVAASLSPGDARSGSYELPLGIEPGEHTVVLRAVDAAGNHTDSDPVSISVAPRLSWIESLSHMLPAFTISPIWMLLIAALVLSLLSLLMNIVLWRRLKSAESRATKAKMSKSVVGRVQKETKQSLERLKKNLQKQDKSLARATMGSDVTPQDSQYVKKVREHLAEAEAFIDQKLKEVDKS